MRIRIIRGIYGHREKGRVIEKSSRTGDFNVSDEEGMRLVSLGIAEKAGADKEMGGQETEGCGEPEEEPEDGFQEDGEEDGFPEPLEEMRIEELRKIAGEMGLKKNGSKEELVDRIRESMEQEEDEDGEMPELYPAEVE